MNASRSSADVVLRVVAASFGLAVALALPDTRAATLTWGTTGTGGAGTWDTTATGWWNGSSNVAWVNANNDVAYFGGTSGTVTLNTAITANGLTFDTTGYTVTGNTITLSLAGATVPTITTNAGVTATINSGLAGSNGLVKSGSGTLVFDSQKTYTGTTTINAGTLRITGGGNNAAGALASGTIVVNTGGTLRLSQQDAIGYTANREALVITGGTVTIDTGLRATIRNTITMTGGVLTSTGTGDASGNYSLLNSGINATSDAAGNPATVNCQVLSMQNATTTFNVTRGVATPASDLTISATIANFSGETTFGITKTGNGVLTLTGTNTFAGPFTIADGTVSVPTINNASTAGPLGNSANAVVLGAASGSTGALLYTGPTASSSKTFTLATGGTGAVNVSSASTTLTLSGAISGSGNFLKLGSGTLTLSAANNYSGLTTVGGGRVNVTNTLRSTSSVTVTSGTLDLNATNIFVGGHGTAVADSMVLTATGAGSTIILNSGNEARIGNVTLASGGTLTSNRTLTSYDWLLANVSSGTWATVAVRGNAAAAMNGGGGIHLSGVQNFDVADVTSSSAVDLTVSMTLGDGGTGSGTGGVNKSGAGTMRITTAATYTGTTVVNAGILELNTANYTKALASSGIAVNPGATLDINGINVLHGSGTPTPITVNSGSVRLTYASGGGHNHFGLLTLNSGTIYGQVAATPFNSEYSTFDNNITVGGSNTSTISGANSAFSYSVQVSGLVFNVASTGATSGIDLLVSSPLSGVTYTKAGAGLMRLTQAGSGAAPTIRAGTIVAANSTALGTSGTVTLNDASTGSSNTSLLLDASAGTVTLSRPITVANQGTGTATIGSSANAGSNSAVFSGAITLAKDVTLSGVAAGDRTEFTGGISGNGNVTISTVSPGRILFRSTANSYSGTTTITANSTAQLGDGGSTSLSFLPDGFPVTVSGILNLAKGGNSETIDALLGAGTVGAISGADTLVVGSAGGSGTFSGVLQNNGAVLAFTKSGAGTQVLTGSNTYTGATTVTDGTLQVGAGGTTGWLPGNPSVSAGATLAFSRSDSLTFSGTVSSGGNLTQLGSGTLTLAAANTYTGTTSLAAGVLALGNANAIGTTGTISFTGGTLQYTASNSTDYSSRFSTGAGQAYRIDTNGQGGTLGTALTSSGATLTKLGSGTLTLTANNTYSGATTISAGVLRLGNGGSAGSVAGNIVNNASLQVNRSDAFNLSNAISGSGGVEQAGSGTTTLSGANSYSGMTTISGGALSISQDTNLGTAPGSATPDSLVINGGRLVIPSGFTLSSNRGIAVGPASGAGSGTIDVASGVLDYGGVIANNGAGTNGLVKAGAGTLRLSGISTYTGTTSVDAGTLQLQSGASLASPTVAVASGATLSGRGTVNAVTVASGGLLAPGVATSGTLTTGNLTFSGLSTVTMAVSGTVPSTLLNVLGNVSPLGGTGSVTFSFPGQTLSNIVSGTYSLLTYTGVLSNTSAFLVTGGTGGRQSVSISDTAVANAVSLIIGNSFPIWTGTNGTDWFATNNWRLNTNGDPTDFQNLDTVEFNDLATSGTVVISGSNATPATTTFSGNTMDMTLGATGGFGISTGALVKSGSALVTITNANTFDGGTTLSAGRLRVGDDAALGSGTISFVGPSALSSDGATARSLANGLHVDDDVTLGDAGDTGALTLSGTVNFDGNTHTLSTPSNVTLSGLVTNGGFEKAGAGVLTVTGSNTYGNGTTLSAGTLRVGNNGALGAGGVTLANGVTLSSDSTTGRTLTNAFTLNGNVTLGSAVDTGALTLGGVGGVNLGGATRQVTTASDVTFAGAVSSGGLTKAGTGTLTLTAANSYAAGTTLSAGDISLGNVAGLGTGTATYAGAGTIRNSVAGTIANAIAVNSGVSGTFDSAANATTLSGGIANAGTFTLTTTATQTLAGAVSGTGTIVMAGSGRAVVTGTSTYTGDTTISAGTLEVGGAGLLGNGSYAGTIANAGTLAVTTSANQTLSGAVSGIGSLTKSGAGTLTLSNAANSFSGGSTISGGVLAFANGALGTSGNVTVTGGTLRWATGNTQDVSSRLVLVNSTTATLDVGANDVTLASGLGAGTSGAVVKAGAGTLTLTGSSGYTGLTTVSAGTLQLGAGGSIAGNVTNNATLTFDRSDAYSYAGTIAGTGLVRQIGTGTVTLGSSNSYSGGTSLVAGVLSFVNGGLGSGTTTMNGGALRWASGNSQDVSSRLALVNSTTATLDTNGNNVTLATAVGGSTSGALVKTGGGTLKITAVGTYTGATVVNGGTLELNTPQYVRGLATSGITVNAGATFLINGMNILYTGASYIPITVNSGTVEIGGASGNHCHFGALTLNGGVIYGSNPSPYIGQYSTFDADVTVGGTARSTISGSSASSGYYLASTGRTFTVASTGDSSGVDLLVSSPFLENATSGLVKAGAGVMQLTAKNTYTGNTTINAGTLAIAAGGQVYNGAFIASVLTVGSGATLDLQNWQYNITGTASLGGLSANATSMVVSGGAIRISGSTPTTYGRGVTVNSAGATLDAAAGANWTIDTVNDNNAWVYNGNPTITLAGGGTGRFDKVLGNGTGGLVKSGSGMWTLTGVNTFTGNTTISAGTLVLGGAGQLGSGNYGGTIANAGAFLISTSANQTLAGIVSGTGSFTKSDAGTLTLSNASNSFTGGVRLMDGTLAFASGGLGSGTVSMNGGTLQWASGNTQDVSGQVGLVSGGTATLDTNGNNVTLGTGFGGGSSASLVKTGAGTLALTGSNDFTGGTTLSQGTLAFASGGLGSSGNVALAASTTLQWAAGNTQDVSGRLVLPNSGTATLDVGINDVTLGNGFGAGSSGSLTKTGAGTLTLTGSNGYTGNTAVTGGTLAIAGGGSIASSGGMNVGSGAALDIAAAAGLVSVGTLTGDGNVTLGGNTLRTTVVGESIAFGGVISGAGGFTKAGSDTLELTSLQSFTGTARVEQGVLVLTSGTAFATASRIYVDSGAILESPGLTVVNDQTLGGYGTVAGDLALLAGGTLSPGGSVGTLSGTAGTTTWNGGMHYLFEVNDAAGTAGVDPGWDLFTTTGGLTLNVTGTDQIFVDLTSLSGTAAGPADGFDPSFNYAWKFVVAGSTIGYEYALNPTWFKVETGAFQNTTNGSFYVARGDQLGGVNASGFDNELYVVYAAVPEPGTLGLAGIGLAAAGCAGQAAARGGRVEKPAATGWSADLCFGRRDFRTANDPQTGRMALSQSPRSRGRRLDPHDRCGFPRRWANTPAAREAPMIATAPQSRRRVPVATRRDRSPLAARRKAFFALEIDYIPCRAFLKADAERLATVPPADAAVPLDRSDVEPPRGEGLTPYLASLYRTRLLTRDEEQFYFRRMNWLKFRAAADRGRLDRRRATARQMDRIEGLLAEADTVKAVLVTSNLRLVVSIAKKFTAPAWTFEELVSEGNMALIRAVEKFNFALGNRFSTYATYAVQRHFYRLSQRGRAFRSRFTSDDAALESRAAPPPADPQPTAKQLADLKSLFAGFLAELEPRERRIVVARFGFDGKAPRTFRELGAQMGVCKERIRQIQGRAMEKLRSLAAEARLEQTVGDWL